MTDYKQKSVPVRVRFRSPTEYPLDISMPSGHGQDKTSTSPSPTSDMLRHTQQIKELLRLSNLLRADLGLSEVLQQITASMASCTGFRILVVNLIDEREHLMNAVAFTGIPQEHERILRERSDHFETLRKAMRPEFRISQSYYISHEHREILQSGNWLKSTSVEDYPPGGWHPEDVLLVPLFSLREQKTLGVLSIDDPEDGRVPTLETIEVIELFANQAAIAIDNAHLFREREEERLALERGIAVLREDLEQLQSGNLRVRVRAFHPKLQPVADAINTMTENMGSILSSVQMVTRAVDEHTRNVQHNSELLVRDTIQQERQVNQISYAIGEIVDMMRSVSERAAQLSETAIDAVDVTVEAQGSVDRAVEGMGMVREATMQSARTMKSLSESGQEINETVMAITDLTTRMHLLALNAAIEATRAGEYGHGFSVVAKEMRTLAVHSGEAARKVGAYIRTFQQETTAVSQSVEQSTQHVVMQTERVTQTGVALEAISVVTEQLTNLIQGVCATAESQDQGSQMVVNAVNEILRMTTDITQHMREMQQSMVRLVELTDSLRSRMAVFNLVER